MQINRYHLVSLCQVYVLLGPDLPKEWRRMVYGIGSRAFYHNRFCGTREAGNNKAHKKMSDEGETPMIRGRFSFKCKTNKRDLIAEVISSLGKVSLLLLMNVTKRNRMAVPTCCNSVPILFLPI